MGKATGIDVSQYTDYKEYQRQYYLRVLKPARAKQKKIEDENGEEKI